jgi:hypothetical protein
LVLITGIVGIIMLQIVPNLMLYQVEIFSIIILGALGNGAIGGLQLKQIPLGLQL